jgi:hypothetical protein
MNARLFLSLFARTLGSILAQAPASAPTASPAQPQIFTSDIGFAYTLPADWVAMDMSGALEAQRERAQQGAADDAAKKALACIQIPLAAHHGAPGSLIVAIQLPLTCFGSEMTDKDVPGFGVGATQGIRQGFDIGEPQTASYTLGVHTLWVARASGNPKGHPEFPYTVETVCSLLKKGPVCWMALAADADALSIFEHAPVTLETDPPAALVPATVVLKKSP